MNETQRATVNVKVQAPNIAMLEQKVDAEMERLSGIHASLSVAPVEIGWSIRHRDIRQAETIHDGAMNTSVTTLWEMDAEVGLEWKTLPVT